MATRALPLTPNPQGFAPRSLPAVDWRRVARLLHASRALDDIEESRLVPEKKVLYQFSARGHELGQVLLGLRLTAKHDGVGVYYRSRPLMLALGLELEEAAAGPLARAGSFGYTVRVVPKHANLASPAELGLIAVAH